MGKDKEDGGLKKRRSQKHAHKHEGGNLHHHKHEANNVPMIYIIRSAARFIEMSWMVPLPPKDISSPALMDLPSTTYQLVKAENDDPEFRVCYEGSSTQVTIEGLKPQTTYHFKLRVWDEHENDFSREFTETVVATTDESENSKAEMLLFRAVNDNDDVKLAQYMDEYRHEVSLEARDKNGRTMLMAACQKGTAAIITTLLKAGAIPTATTSSRKTALSIAVSSGNLAAVQALVNYPNLAQVILAQPDVGGSTPLMWAVENSNHKYGVDIVTTLLKAGADVTVEDSHGLTALERLCQTSGNPKCARMLLDRGAKLINRCSKRYNMTTLMIAAMNGHKDLCMELVDKWHADMYATTEHGQTAMEMAETKGYDSVVSFFEKRVRQARQAQ